MAKKERQLNPQLPSNLMSPFQFPNEMMVIPDHGGVFLMVQNLYEAVGSGLINIR